MAPSKWRNVKSGQVLQPLTRQIAREIEQHASQCGFNVVPLNEIASQQEMMVERLELGIKRGDHHCPGDGGKHHFEPKSCFRKGHSGICPICFGIFKKQRNGGCRDHFKKCDELLEEWPSDWKEQYMANASRGLIGKGRRKIHKTLIQMDEDERHKERMLLEQEAEQAATDAEKEILEQQIEDLSMTAHSEALADAETAVGDEDTRLTVAAEAVTRLQVAATRLRAIEAQQSARFWAAAREDPGAQAEARQAEDDSARRRRNDEEVDHKAQVAPEQTFGGRRRGGEGRRHGARPARAPRTTGRNR